VSAYVPSFHRVLIGSCLAPQEEHRGDAGLRRLLEVELVHVLHRLYSAFDDAVAARPRLYKASERKSHPVGKKKPNAWGLHDMHGNVEEWCVDWRGPYPTEEVTDPQGANSGPGQVIRGGGWNYNAHFCRSARRFCYSPSYGAVGFRLVRSSTP
jgi:formylglycine-generating enzyme required for sulfatase activity